MQLLKTYSYADDTSDVNMVYMATRYGMDMECNEWDWSYKRHYEDRELNDRFKRIPR